MCSSDLATNVVMDQMPSAALRLFAGKIEISSAWLPGIMGPETAPCSTRKKISEGRLQAMPHRSEAMVKASTELVKVRNKQGEERREANRTNLERLMFHDPSLIDDEAPVPASIQPGLAEAVVLRVSREALSQWLQPQAGHSLQDHWFLVDPQGEWMMRFGPNLDAKSAMLAKKDLERLLRAANGWDKAGR